MTRLAEAENAGEATHDNAVGDLTRAQDPAGALSALTPSMSTPNAESLYGSGSTITAPSDDPVGTDNDDNDLFLPLYPVTGTASAETAPSIDPPSQDGAPVADESASAASAPILMDDAELVNLYVTVLSRTLSLVPSSSLPPFHIASLTLLAMSPRSEA